MRFVIDIPDSEKERMIALAVGIEGKMVFSGFNISFEEKLLVGMVQALNHSAIAIPLNQEKYRTLDSLKGASYKDEFIVIRTG